MPNPLANANVGALPNTGVDPGPMASQGPQAGMGPGGMPPAAPTAPTPPTGAPPAGGQAQTSPEAVREAIDKLSAVGAVFSGILDRPGPITRKEVIDAAVKLVARRIMSAQSMAQTLKDLPTDPQDVREWLQRIADGVTKSEIGLHQLMSGIRAPGHPAAEKLGPGFVMPPGEEQPQGGPPPTLQ